MTANKNDHFDLNFIHDGKHYAAKVSSGTVSGWVFLNFESPLWLTLICFSRDNPKIKWEFYERGPFYKKDFTENFPPSVRPLIENWTSRYQKLKSFQ